MYTHLHEFVTQRSQIDSNSLVTHINATIKPNVDLQSISTITCIVTFLEEKNERWGMSWVSMSQLQQIYVSTLYRALNFQSKQIISMIPTAPMEHPEH